MWLVLLAELAAAGTRVIAVLPEARDALPTRAAQRRIGRALDAAPTFWPASDLCQQGRSPDRSPDAAATELHERVAATLAVQPWTGARPQEVFLREAERLREVWQTVGFVDRRSLDEPVFDLHVALGEVVLGLDEHVPPWFDHIGGHTLNLHLFLAAQLAAADRTLLARIATAGIHEEVRALADQIEDGVFVDVRLRVGPSTPWARIEVNGRPVAPDAEGDVRVVRGRHDIAFVRDDGHGPSLVVAPDERLARVDLHKRARQVSEGLIGDRVRLGEQPGRTGTALLAAYQQLHRSDRIVLAVGARPGARRWLLWCLTEGGLVACDPAQQPGARRSTERP